MNFNRVLRTFYYSAKNFRVIAEVLRTILHDIQFYRSNEKESRQSYDYSASKIVTVLEIDIKCAAGTIRELYGGCCHEIRENRNAPSYGEHYTAH
jgi:hypothetical protein